MRIGLVTCFEIPKLLDADKALIPLLQNQNHQVETVVWNDTTIDWKLFNALIIRSPWDYYLNIETFEKWLLHIENLKIPLCNSVDIIRNNMHKFYLRNLQKNGVEIIPTVFVDKTNQLDLSFIKDCNWEMAIIKPAISAASYRTEKFKPKDWPLIANKYQNIANNCDLLVQKYMPEIETYGEVSLIFFGGIFSHAVLKIPRAGDFRVQVQFGGQYSNFAPRLSTKKIAQDIVNSYENIPVYARIDGIETSDNFYLMEVELIEPDLYFEFAPVAREKFVKSVMNEINR